MGIGTIVLLALIALIMIGCMVLEVVIAVSGSPKDRWVWISVVSIALISVLLSFAFVFVLDWGTR